MTIINKDIQREYNIIKTLNAGICLLGGEVRSIRSGNFSFKNAYVDLRYEAILRNFKIRCKQSYFQKFNESREKRLLIKKKERLKLASWIRLYKGTVLVSSIEENYHKIKFNLALVTKKQIERKKSYILEKKLKKHNNNIF